MGTDISKHDFYEVQLHWMRPQTINANIARIYSGTSSSLVTQLEWAAGANANNAKNKRNTLAAHCSGCIFIYILHHTRRATAKLHMRWQVMRVTILQDRIYTHIDYLAHSILLICLAVLHCFHPQQMCLIANVSSTLCSGSWRRSICWHIEANGMMAGAKRLRTREKWQTIVDWKITDAYSDAVNLKPSIFHLSQFLLGCSNWFVCSMTTGANLIL